MVLCVPKELPLCNNFTVCCNYYCNNDIPSYKSIYLSTKMAKISSGKILLAVPVSKITKTLRILFKVIQIWINSK